MFKLKWRSHFNSRPAGCQALCAEISLRVKREVKNPVPEVIFNVKTPVPECMKTCTNIHEGKTSVSIIYITFNPLTLTFLYACAYTREGKPDLAEQSG